MRLLFCGTGTFAATILKGVTDALPKIEPVVMAKFPVLGGRGNKKLIKNGVFNFATERGYQLVNAPQGSKFLLDEYKEGNIQLFKSCTLGIVVDFGYFLPYDFLNLPQLGFVNVHPSLLPKYRGASPIQYALLNGDNETGVSIVRIDPNETNFDSGRILSDDKKIIAKNECFNDVTLNLGKSGSNLLVRLLQQDNLSKIIQTGRVQDTLLNKTSWAPKLQSKQAFINFEEEDAERVINMYRAFHGNIGIKLRIADTVIDILEMDMTPVFLEESLKPGEHIFKKAGKGRMKLFVGTLKGCVAINQVRIQTKKEVSITDIFNGFAHKWKGSRFF